MNIQYTATVFFFTSTLALGQQVEYQITEAHVQRICGLSLASIHCNPDQKLIRVKACSVNGGDIPIERYSCNPEKGRGNIHTVGTQYGSGMNSWESAIAVAGVPSGRTVQDGAIIFPPQTCLDRIGYADVRAPRGNEKAVIVQSKSAGDILAKGTYPVDLHICINFK